jgi:CheY-like chemotaxis protein
MNPRGDLSVEAGWVVVRYAANELGGSIGRTDPGVAALRGHDVRPEVARGPILVVDDDPSIREVIAETLRLEGYWVVEAADGAEALHRIGEQLPSLILLDMRMPVLDGWGVAHALKERGIRVPTVVVTAASNAEAWAREIAAEGYLAKPFQDTELLQLVERFAGPPQPNAES